MSNLIRIATRKSPLALVQANRVKELIEKRLKDTTVKLITRSTPRSTNISMKVVALVLPWVPLDV